MSEVTPRSHTSELLIVTGLSGAGRSTVANALEDLGWFVVDNLPPQMVEPLLHIVEASAQSLPRLAVVMDLRGGSLFSHIDAQLDLLRASGVSVRILFLEASDEILVRRFEQVRRPHPLQGDGTLVEGIGTERARLKRIRDAADVIIDTSTLNVHQLTTRIGDVFAEEGSARLQITVMSFGFKYGLPLDADMVADMRFLPNPFWIPELRPLTGRDAAVSDYVLTQEGAGDFLGGYLVALRAIIDGYQRESKHHAVFAIGCTGGKHRSVAITEYLSEALQGIDGVSVQAKHRDLGKE